MTELLAFIRWAIDTGREEAHKAAVEYWRSRDFGPIPPPLDRWDAFDRATDRRLKEAREKGQP